MNFEDKQFPDLFELSGRPARNTTIGKDDIDDMLIALNTTDDVTAFLSVIA